MASARPTRTSQGTPLLAGRYELGGWVGQGGSGRCRLARDALLGRTVVVKAVPAASGSVLREAKAAGQLNHPNIVTVHDVVETTEATYLVMEHAEGGSLQAVLERGPVPHDHAKRILDDILAGLEAAHARGIVHGDLKPANILLAADGRAKLADFGSARATSAEATMSSLPTREGGGTLLYMAPEQVEGERATTASDLYAVGAIAWQLFTGEHYLQLRGKSDLQLREAIVRGALRPLPRPLSRPLEDWLRRALAKGPDGRWAMAGPMRQALATA
jgi:eukaryotic-like serine/threonine-protein kinase